MQLTTVDYNGHPISIRDDGWFNATEAAARFGQKPNEWLRLPGTERYMEALGKALGFDAGKSRIRLVSTSKTRGQAGTWLHPKLAVAFARWLDDDFAVWCDCQIDSVIRGTQDWSRLRHVSTAAAKLLGEVIKDSKASNGATAEPKHFMTEHKLVNWLLTGKFEGLHRDSLAGWQLDFIGHFDIRDSLLIAKGMAYAERKTVLKQESTQWFLANAHRIASANEAITIQAA